jgi:alpha-mannosidase
MKRQGLIITVNELKKLIEEIEDKDRIIPNDTKVQINIINKTPECSDTWKIEDSQINENASKTVEVNKGG